MSPKTLPRVSKSGFKFSGPKEGILLLHGFSGTPYDLKPLGLFLHNLGYSISAPLLFGHGKTANDLMDATQKLWLKDAHKAWEELNNPKIIIGLSMGGLLAIKLYKTISPKPKALILLSPSLVLNIIGKITKFLLDVRVLPQALILRKLSGHSDILDPIAQKKCPSLPEIPLKAFLQFDNLRESAIKIIPKISCPLFVAFARKDGAINIYKSKDLILNAKSSILITKDYQNSKHVITLDYERDQLNQDIADFIKDILRDEK